MTGGFYTYEAAGYDALHSSPSAPQHGDLLRVVELPADTQALVEGMDGARALVMTASLRSIQVAA